MPCSLGMKCDITSIGSISETLSLTEYALVDCEFREVT